MTELPQRNPRLLDSEPLRTLGRFVALAVLACAAGWDLAVDLGAGSTVVHALVEGTIAVVALMGAAFAARRLSVLFHSERTARRDARDLAQRLRETERDALRWRNEAQQALEGLSVAIDRQFERWALTRAESEVALLLLKGLSHKEIAALRGASEGTVRQQARAVYRKAGLDGRHDLAAFFLEDLLLPVREAGAEGRT